MKNFSWQVFVLTILIPISLLACTVNPIAQNQPFTEIGLEEALIQYPQLMVEAYPYDPSKSHEGRNFTPLGMSLQEVMAKRAAEREKPFPRKDYVLGDKVLGYSYGGFPGRGEVLVQLDGKTIFKAAYGDDAPINPVGGLWALDDKWILELIHIKTRNEDNTIYTETRGDIIIDRQSMNKTFGYDESFGFQIMAGKPFYFYKKDGRVGINFGGQHFKTNFNEVPHYACCSGAAANPFHYQNMVSFFATSDEGHYYTEIGVYP